MTDQFASRDASKNMNALPKSFEKLTDEVQQPWNRAIPESDYIQLGTLRYGVRLSNPNLLNLNTSGNEVHNGGESCTQDARASINSYDNNINGSSTVSAGDNSRSSSSSATNKSCCCVGGGTIGMPWNNSYTRSRLPLPNTMAKNRKSSPSTSASSSSSSFTHQQLHLAQRQISTQQEFKGKLKYNNAVDHSNFPKTTNSDDKKSYDSTSVDKQNQNRETPPSTISTVCCYSNRFDTASNKNAKNNNLSKVSNKYSDSKTLKIVNNSSEHKDIQTSGSNGINLNCKNSLNLSGSEKNEYGAVSRTKKISVFPAVVCRKETVSSSANSVKLRTDGDDTNIKFGNAQQLKESCPVAVNINNLNRNNSSSFSENRTECTTNQIKRSPFVHRYEVGTDEFSSSSSLSPTPSIPTEPWLIEYNTEFTARSSPVPLANCSFVSDLSQKTRTGSQTSKFSTLSSGPRKLHTSHHRIINESIDPTTSNQSILKRLAKVHNESQFTCTQNVDWNSTYENASTTQNFMGHRKSSLPVIHHVNVIHPQRYRKLSSDIAGATGNGRSDEADSSVVKCHLTPKLSHKGATGDHLTPETRLQSLNRYCAQNLNRNVSKTESGEISFIDSSDLSSTGEDVITVITEDEYREYQKFHSLPHNGNALVNDSCQSDGVSTQISECFGVSSSDELSSVCSGSDTVLAPASFECIEDTKRNFHVVRYRKCNVPDFPYSVSFDRKQGISSGYANSVNQNVTTYTQSDTNNNQHNSNIGKEQTLSYFSNRSREINTISNERFSLLNKFNDLSPDNSSSSLNCFGRNQLYAKTSPEKPIMDRRSNTLDRLQKLVKKTSTGSNEKSGDKHASNKTERLKELTELLKGTRVPPVPPPRRLKHPQCNDKSFERQNTATSTRSLLNIDGLHKEDNKSCLKKTKESRSIDIPYQFADNNQSSAPNSPRSEHKVNLRANVSTSNLENLRSNTNKSTNNEDVYPETSFKEDDEIFTKLPRPESRTIVGSYTQKTIPFRSASFSQVDYSSGKYIRSALGAIKNSLTRGKDSAAMDNVVHSQDKKECTRSCSPAQFTPTLESEQLFTEEEIPRIIIKKTELNINLALPDEFERIDGVDGRELASNRNSDIETIVEDPEAEHIETIANEEIVPKITEINVNQASEMILEPLVEEGIPITPRSLSKDEECLQQATTCLIPVPVYDCVVSEWSTARPSEQWIDASATECAKLTDCTDSITEANENGVEFFEPMTSIVNETDIENLSQSNTSISTHPVTENMYDELKTYTVGEEEENESIIVTPPVSIVYTEPDSLVSTAIIGSPLTSVESTVRLETTGIVEVRKRHSNNEENGEAFSSCNSEIEEKRRIDKSKRRKGIYIQWPAIDTNIDPESDSNDNCTPDESWRPDKLSIEKDSSLDLSGESFPDLSTKDITSSPEKNKETHLHHAESSLIELNTPDSDIGKPAWPKESRRKSLTYQSSDEKDDSAPTSIPMRSFRNLFLRSDSVSDNESERASSRDRTSASPAPSCEYDLKRYSKRPLRGPYGQMLEAEMKKPSKVHYNEILEELSKHESPHSFPSFSRNRGGGSQSMDETNDRHSNKIFKPRKTNANLPIPAHSRTASSPSKLADLGNTETTPTGINKRHLGNIEQRSTDSDKSEKSTGKLESKKFSLDSHFSEKNSSHEKHSKRSSSGANDKHQKRSLDDTRYSQSSRTPSERSFVLNSPEQPKGLVASPELLAELLKGSSEKLVAEQISGGASPHNANNALPSAVLKYLDTRTHVVVELFNTEKSYVESLQTIVLKYLNQLKSPENAGLVDTQTVDEIFFMVPAILNIHERFLEELRRRLDTWDPLQKIGDAFVDVFSRPVILDTYTSFVNNWNRAKDAIRTTRQKCPAFARFLEAMAREHKGKLSLDNLLIKPVQKFPNYELILSRLIKHTDIDHPDQKLLQEALKLVHDILVFLNCKEKEALENGQRETVLRELEGVIEGISDLVTSDRAFVLFDLVSMPSGQATRKERGFFLFNDLLVITSIKRRSGTIRKTNITCPGSVASTLDTNKYKFLTKISLDDLEIVKSKDENIRRIMREIEHLSEDSNKLSQMLELASSLRCTHQLLEESIRELQREVQRQLSERQTNDAQLNILELTLKSSNGIQNMTVVFSKPDKRTQWEEAFTEAKHKLASSVERSQVPEFLVSVPIRKTRAGLQFTCASPTLGIQRDVWVCNSDGYVGQVCVLSLVPEPTVTSCNGVCNARILCVASVPASDESHTASNVHTAIQEPPASIASTINSIVNSVSKPRDKRCTKLADDNITSEKNSSNIQLDSDSSSEDSETESQPERSISPTQATASTEQIQLSVVHRPQESNSEEADVQQSTMWLGTEDGCIHVYNCTDNIRIKKNKIKIPHISAVYSILYLCNKVFVSLANGDICVYTRDHNGWNTTTPLTVSIGTVTSPVTKLLSVQGKLWCAIQGCIKVLNTTTLQVNNHLQISIDSKPVTNMTALNDYVWISVQNSALIKCCHHESFEIIFEVNLAPSVNKMLSNCDDIIRQHKAACLRVTSLLACKDLIWVGTSAGVLLTIAASNISKGSPIPAVTGIPHGHTGHVRFLTFVESPDSADFPKTNHRKSDSVNNKTNPNLLVISGGDGYEDFRGTGNNTMSEIAGREDSTNHLLLWQI
ncbi:uncharacterized protein LOC131433085 [Malaya genurostris]|uniref:uncharacterized protein LOC131433085 n=1 Tax=Malaya genurostris TaxID=325434 RepID=UPI0026F3E1B6|nr:uncharacterized protein LOC131433085 [Malaya genurostris]XP_058455845.1 uncharacterized protein LOC131433085 [Malaya genurostris]XP_058455846.1 uncharacterized protein LOC131433085 [Malaya genurostris]XP_058455848.1 uncharacterized protein LOC131433085 [Malaya genurostris]XP_058455849.1 uncharacterized protein LOC131433085 [Malaya genurostris]